MRVRILLVVAMVLIGVPISASGDVVTYLERGDDGAFRPVVVQDGEKRVIDRPAISGPSLSRDGSRIAFTVDDPSRGSYSIAVSGVQGGNVRMVTEGSWGELDPSWAPGGERIVSSWYPTVVMGDTMLGVVDVASGAVRSIPGTEGALRPAWSPSGKWIAFERDGAVWLIHPDGSGERRVADGSDPTWGPGNREITFVQGSRLARASLVGEPAAPVHSFEGTLESPTCRPVGCTVMTYSGLGYDGRSAAKAWFLPVSGKPGVRRGLGRAVGLDAVGPPGLLDYFVDDEGNIHESDINTIARRGISVGCNPPQNDRFCPSSDVSRGQMAAFLVRALDLPPAQDAGFQDTAGSVFADDINSLAAAGITYGCNPPANSLFCPSDSVTRGQMAAFLVRALELPPGEPDQFGDDDGLVFEDDIDALASSGVTIGCNPPENTQFCPIRPVSRAEMASFLVRGLHRG